MILICTDEQEPEIMSSIVGVKICLVVYTVCFDVCFVQRRINTDYIDSLDSASDLYQEVPVRISAGTPTAAREAITRLPQIAAAAPRSCCKNNIVLAYVPTRPTVIGVLKDFLKKWDSSLSETNLLEECQKTQL